ncbi:MAG: thiamine biosynthesis protein ApbE [Rhodobacterales bacterium]|nr:MAG: thiamine biosynthesis protein ApbE [Rhodobacterales bacterium]
MTEPELFHRSGTVMGGPWQIRITPAPGLDAGAAARAGLAALELVDRQMSTYRETSDLMRLNHAPEGDWVPVPADLHAVMAEAREIARASGGALNIALGGLVNAWGFGPDPAPAQIPDAAARRARDARAALDSYELRADPPAVRKTAPAQFDLCAIAKGFAVDQAARALRAAGATGFLVEAAGEIYASGARPDGSPWVIGLELPVPGKRIVYDQVALAEGGLATSGQYRNRREVAGASYGHTLSPVTGMPLDGDLLAVTVQADSVMRADGFATAIFVLGETEGLALANRHRIAAQLVCYEKTGARVIASHAWAVQTAQTAQAAAFAPTRPPA